MLQRWTSICRISTVLITASVLAAQDSKPLPEPASPGKAIQDAAQGSFLYRATPEPAPLRNGPIDILSDTRGVDFGPYVNGLLPLVRENWYALIPANATAKKGKLAIEFTVRKDGHVGVMHLVASSGDVTLDRAAWGGITRSDPFPPLPGEFTGPSLSLRFRFYYNPDKADFVTEGIASNLRPPIVHAVLIGDLVPPQYPKKASKGKVEGMVRLEANVGPDGRVRSVNSLEGSPVLEEAAKDAVLKWRFQPAHQVLDGKPTEDQVLIKVEFRLDGQQVHAQVISPQPTSTVSPAQ